MRANLGGNRFTERIEVTSGGEMSIVLRVGHERVVESRFDPLFFLTPVLR